MSSDKQQMKIANLIAEKFSTLKLELVGDHFTSYSAKSALSRLFKKLNQEEASGFIQTLEKGNIHEVNAFITEKILPEENHV